MYRKLMILSSAAFVFSCFTGITEEEAIDRFNDALVGKQSCEIDTDCTIIRPGCPIGCNASVHVDHADELNEIASDLVRRYNAGGQSCDYVCIAAYPVCVIDQCETRGL